MYYIKRGKVRLSHVTVSGQEKMLLYMGEGMLFNEIPMLTVSSDYMFTCVDNTEAIFWTRKQITADFVSQHPELVLNLMESMGRKIQNFYVQLCGMSSYGSFTNVCRILYSMHLFQQKNGVVVPGISKQELADFLGIHRSSLHKALARLQEEGVVGAYTRNYLEVEDVEALKSYAEALTQM
jgi:CRP-like cAMP-binding protein